MTTDPSPEQILDRIDRAIELLEDIRDARRARIEVEITTLADHERVFIPVTAGDQHKH